MRVSSRTWCEFGCLEAGGETHSDATFFLSEKHSQYSTVFPIYLLEHSAPGTTPKDVEDEEEQDGEEQDATAEPTWVRLNDQTPIWMR